MRTLFLIFAIGSCLLAQAADPNANKPADSTAKQITVATVTEAAKQPTATADRTPDFNVAIVDAADPAAKKLDLKTATAEEVKALTDKKPLKHVLTAGDAAKPTPFKDKIVRVQVAAGNRNEIFTLENVRLISLLGDEFIVGRAVKYGNDRFSGLEIYLNVRLVMTIVAMTPEQAKKFNESQQGSAGRPYTPQGGQGPYNPPQRGPFVPPPGQRPYIPPQGYPQQGQGPYTPPQGFNPQPGYYPPQGSQGPYIPSQGGPGPYTPPPRQGPYIPPQGNQGPYNPPQGGPGPYSPPPGQGPYNPPQGNQGPYNPPQGGPGPYSPPPGQGPYNPPQGVPCPFNPPAGNNPPQGGPSVLEGN